MELWIRSTAKTNLLKARFLTIIEGKKFYEKNEWEYKGYTIANCTEHGYYELLGTYKTKERALEVLDEIQEMIKPTIITTDYECKCEDNPNDKLSFNLRMEPQKKTIQELSTYVYEMPED